MRRFFRICGNSNLDDDSKKSDKYFFAEDIGDLFGLNITFDTNSLHPQLICSKCTRTFYRYRQFKLNKQPFTTDLVPSNFDEHGPNCKVCSKKGKGRPPSVTKKRKLVGKIHKSSYDDPFSEHHEPDMYKKGHQERKKEKQDTTVPKKVIYNCVHFEFTNNCVSCMVNGFHEVISRVSEDEKAAIFSQLLELMSKEDRSILAYQFGLKENTSIRKDAQSFALMYKDVDAISSFDVTRWLHGRNAVIKNFMLGTGQLDFRRDTYGTDKTIVLASVVEQSYKICVPNLVSPFAFLQNLCLYTLTGSKTAIDIFGRTAPSGGYKTIYRWLYDQKAAEPVCPPGETMNVFDNEQIIGRKTAIKPNSKARVSIITNKGTTQLSDECTLQKDKKYKPFQILKRQDLGGEHDNKLKDVAQDVIDQENERYKTYETLHYEQLFHFLNVSLKCVADEQDQKDDEIQGLILSDFIDNKITQEDESNKFTTCATCGT